MMKIKVLDKKVYELIAAGEVISRPVFVVKELVENSIDAKSSQISVEIKNGGKSLIRVVDNGVGMSFDDCKVAFLRHATSKIKNETDLNSLQTLGFRGEALASICAVSRVEVLTKQKNESTGTHYSNFAGEEQIYEKTDCNEGTQIDVNDLFYNMPARFKFLKSDLTEANLIQDILEKLTISHSEISFSFKKNGKKVFQTIGNGNLSDAIYSVYGKGVFKTLTEVANDFSGISVKGFVSLPVFCKPRGNLNISFVNSRYIKSRLIKNGVEQAFKGASMIGKFPSFILFLNMSSSCVDVNVHPAKTEVSFANENDVLKAVYLAVKKAIDQTNDVFDQFCFSKENEKKDGFVSEKNNGFLENKQPAVECTFKSEVKPYRQSEETFFEFDNFNGNDVDLKFENASKVEENTIETAAIDDLKNEPPLQKPKETNSLNMKQEKNENVELEGIYSLKIVGEIFKTYILAEYKNKFIVVDKHAAHERIIYEKLKKQINNFEKQVLFNPLEISINSSLECELILSNINIFNYFGFNVEHFGNHNFLIRAVPAVLTKQNCLEIFNEIVENLKLKKFDLTPQTIENILHQMACKAAIKANYDNSKSQLYELVKEIYFNKNIRTCPHGRPAILVFSKERFDSDFKRI